MIRLNQLCDFNDDVLRNIVSLRVSQDLFDDLHDHDAHSTEIAIAAESRVKASIPIGQVERSFHYSTAIDYPFAKEKWQATRYSEGNHPVWYASLDLKTTVYETAYHMIRAEKAIHNTSETVIQERAVYRVHCQAALIDLTEKHHPSLVHSSDYTATQRIGRRVYEEGHPGLLTLSARHPSGKNAVIFQKRVLSHSRLSCYLTYRFNPSESSLSVERTPGRVWLSLKPE